MIQYLEAYYLDKPLGVMSWSPECQEGRFEFYPSFLSGRTDLSPIQFSTPSLNDKPPVLTFTKKNDRLIGLPPFLIDCQPGEYAMKLLRCALKSSGKTPEILSPLALCSLLGKRALGVICFEPCGYPELDMVEPVDISRLVRYAKTVYQETDDSLTENRLRELLRSGLFTTANRPEALLAVNDYTGEICSGQAGIPSGFEAWTLVIDGVVPNEGNKLNVKYNQHKKAKACGLDVLPCRQIREGTRTHLLIKRLDRDKEKKIHFQSFAALRDEPADSCEAVFRCMRLLRLPYPEQVEFFKRVVFNELTINRQDNAKSILFTCLDHHEWHLAPTSGIVASTGNGLSVRGKIRNLTTEDLLELGRQQHIRKCREIIEEVQSSLTAVT